MKKWFWPAVTVTVAVSLCLQLATISKWSVWHDEGYSAMLADYPIGELVRRTGLDVHPPLYYLLLKGWSVVFGNSDLALRSMSMVFSAIAVVLTLLLAKRLFGRRVVLYTMPLLALSPVLLRYGQEMRMYTMASVLAVSAIYGFVAYIQTKHNRWLVVYAVATILLLYTHYFISLVLLAPWIVIIAKAVKQRQPLKKWLKEYKAWLVAHVVIMLCFLPWLPTLVEQVRSVSGGFWIPPVTIRSPFSTLSSFTIFRQEWLCWRLAGIEAALAIAVVAFSAWGVFTLLRRGNKNKQRMWSLLIIAAWLAPMLLLFLLSAVVRKHFYYDRYFAPFAMFYAIFLALAVLRVILWRPLVGRLLYVGIICMMAYGVVLASTHGNNYGHANDDIYSMKHIIRGMQVRDDPSVAIAASDLGVYFDARFYLRAGGYQQEAKLVTASHFGKYGNTSLVYDRSDIVISSLKDFAAANPYVSQVWFINHRNQDQQLVPETWQQLEQITDGYAKATLYRVVIPK